MSSNQVKNYYEIMEVEPHAEQSEIKKSYHRLAHKFHPDISTEENAEQKFQEINEAYEVLKNPHRRFIHDSATFKSSVSQSWFSAKKNTFIHNVNKHKIKISANKLNRDSIMQSKIPLLLMGIFVLILSAITIVFLFTIEQVGQGHKQIQTAILEGDKTAIATFENTDIETQKQIIADKNVSQAVVNIYLQDPDKSIFYQLETYDNIVENIILTDTYPTLIAYYKPQIQTAVKQNNFNEAISLLETFKKKYPESQELDDLYAEIQNKKQQRLAVLTKQYTNCLEQTAEPLLNRINCVALARQKIIKIGTSLPTDDLNLQAMYIEGIKYSFIEKDYQQAEKLLSEWKNALPNPSEEREQLQHNLSLYKQRKNITTDLSGYDKEKIITRLGQLITAKELQLELFSISEVQDNLLRYHIDEALELVLLKENVAINTKTIVLLEQLLNVARNSKRYQSNKVSAPWYSSNKEPTSVKKTKPGIANLLQQCRKHFESKRLTTGNSGNALSCYRKILKQDSGNLDAIAGLNAIAKRYKLWAENALQQNKLKKVKSHIAGLAKVNPNSKTIASLKKRLNKAIAKKEYESKKIQPKVTEIKPIPEKNVAKPIEVQETKKIEKVEVKEESCSECSCSKLLKQLSMGVKPLTKIQNKFFQNKCR
ncbi:DnaJ domain-containing protein [Candidatus Halobeggiatoa sp. HSG11]|nr:DnaJ domain-containing protein [Candidatus Halobeggiatoa sp. HSG11]